VASGEGSENEKRDPSVDDAVWIEHLRWVMDHVQQRSDRAGQSLWGVIGVQGVLIAVAASFVSDYDDLAQWVLLAGVLVLVLGAIDALRGSLPQLVPSVNVAHYKEIWAASIAAAKPRDRRSGELTEELLQGASGKVSPIEAAIDSTHRRLEFVRRGVIMTVIAAGLLGVAVMVQVVQGERGTNMPEDPATAAPVASVAPESAPVATPVVWTPSMPTSDTLIASGTPEGLVYRGDDRGE